MVPFCYGEELFIWGARQAVFVTGCCVYYRRFSRISSLCSLFSLSCDNQSVSRHCHMVQEAKLPWAGLITTALQNTWVQNFIYGHTGKFHQRRGVRSGQNSLDPTSVGLFGVLSLAGPWVSQFIQNLFTFDRKSGSSSHPLDSNQVPLINSPLFHPAR